MARRKCKFGKLKHPRGRRVCRLRRAPRRKARRVRISKRMWDQAPPPRSPLVEFQGYRRRRRRRR